MMQDTRLDQPQPPVQKRNSLKRYMRMFIALCIFCLAGFIYWKYYATYSDGVQGGKMQKISRRGNIFKTWEGYILISASADPALSIITPKEWDFTVVSDSIAQVLEADAEKNVILRYHQKNGTLPWRGDTEYIIYAVTLVK